MRDFAWSARRAGTYDWWAAVWRSSGTCALAQGYAPSDVTIITPYVGQLQRLRRELGKYNTTVLLNERDQEALSDDEVHSLESIQRPCHPSLRGHLSKCKFHPLVLFHLAMWLIRSESS